MASRDTETVGYFLSVANFDGAYLSSANLYGAYLLNITWDEDTNWNGMRKLDRSRNVPESKFPN